MHSWAATVAFAATGKPPFGRGPSMAIMDRVRRGEHDLSGIPEPLRQLLADCLHPDAERRPTLDAILGWLRPQVAPTARPVAPPAPDKLTMPYAAARTSPDARSTDVLPGGPARRRRTAPSGSPSTRPSWSGIRARSRLRHRCPAEQGRPPFAERARRATLLVVGALLCGGIVAAYPWFGSVTLLLLVWLLRSGSLAASAAGARRRVRGPKWYDGAQLLIRAPWELLRTLAGTVMLLLWSAGLAVAAALLCYAFVAGETVTLFVCGTVFAAAVWTGPGGLARALTAVARGEPDRSPVEAVAGRHVRPARARHRTRRAGGVARHVVVARERPSAERTDHRTLSATRGRMGALMTQP